MLLASATAALAAFPFARALPSARVVSPLLAATALAAALWVPAQSLEGWRFRKPDVIKATEAIRWNAFSMVGVGPLETRPFARRRIVIDNSVRTVMLSFDGDLEKLGFLRSDYTAAAYQLSHEPKVLIIGAGGGRDILTALLFGASEVRAVEVNPLVFQTSA